MRIRFHGAAGTVTGSMMEIVDERLGVHALVDCGMTQGEDAAGSAAWTGRFPFDPTTLQAVFLTHAHLDHCGRLLELVDSGFKEKIWCTPETRALTMLQLNDGIIQVHPSARPAARAALKALQRDDRWNTEVSPIDKANSLFMRRGALGKVFVRALRSSHLLGAVGWQFMWKSADGTRHALVCYGDSGPTSLDHDAGLLLGDNHQAATPVLSCDHLSMVVESTYGQDPERTPVGRAERLTALARALREVANGATLVVPAFSFGRTQDVLFDIACLRRDDPKLRDVRVLTPQDRTLGDSGSAVYAEHLLQVRRPAAKPHHKVEVRTVWPNRAIWSSLGLDLKDHKQRAVAQVWLQDALGLDAAEPPATASERAQLPGLPRAERITNTAPGAMLTPGTVVVAGSGMGDHGVMHGLLRRALRTEHALIGLVGFGSPGSAVAALRALHKSRTELSAGDLEAIGNQPLDGELGKNQPNGDRAVCYGDVRARVVELPGYGGHATLNQLRRLVAPEPVVGYEKYRIRHPDRLFVVHGAPYAQGKVAESMRELLGEAADVITPKARDARWYSVEAGTDAVDDEHPSA